MCAAILTRPKQCVTVQYTSMNASACVCVVVLHVLSALSTEIGHHESFDQSIPKVCTITALLSHSLMAHALTAEDMPHKIMSTLHLWFRGLHRPCRFKRGSPKRVPSIGFYFIDMIIIADARRWAVHVWMCIVYLLYSLLVFQLTILHIRNKQVTAH